MTFTSALTGQTYHSAEDAAFADGKELNRLRMINPRNPLDDLSPEQIEAAFAKAQLSKAEQIAEADREYAAQQFMQQHPEFVAHQRNGSAIELMLEKMGLSGTTPQDIEAAYEAARERGLVDVQEVEGAPQERHRGADGRFEKLPFTSSVPETTEEEMYKLPMAEIERRARVRALEEAEYAMRPPLVRRAAPAAAQEQQPERRRSSSGISSRGSSPGQVPPKKLSEADLYNMSYDELERRGRE
jgi:hypothetical protein